MPEKANSSADFPHSQVGADRTTTASPASAFCDSLKDKNSKDATPARPLSRVEQMLHAYYDLEDAPERDACHERPSGASLQEHRDPQKPRGPQDRGDNQQQKSAESTNAESVTARQGSGSALKTALQMLNDIPYLQQSSAAAAEETPPALDLNSPEFNMQAFFSSAVRTCSLRELLRLSNELEGEVRVLERDIQTLVYENYGKFLSATETVRRVRNAMSDVEGQLQSLAISVESIEDSSEQLMATVHERAAGIEDLVAFRQLIEQLQLLSTLPELLRRHLMADDPEAALLVYDHARVFLAEQQAPCPHLQRLALLRRDADAVASYARKLLRQRLESPCRELSTGNHHGGVRRGALSYGQPQQASLQQQQQQHSLPLSSADASRIVRLLLRSGESPSELLLLYQRGRREAALLLLQECFSREAARAPRAAASEHQHQESHATAAEEQQPEAPAADGSSACIDAVEEVSKETTGLTLEGACFRLSVQYSDLLSSALRDSLLILRFISFTSHQPQSQPSARSKGPPEAADLRRIREAIELADAGKVSIDVEGELALLAFLSSLVEAAFSRLSAMIASAVPVAASVVRGTSSFVSSLESSWGFLPQSLLGKAKDVVRGEQRKILLEATALAFKRAYAKVAQELHDAIAAAVQQQQQQQQQQQEDGTSSGSGSQGPSFSAVAEMAVAVTRQHPVEQSVVVEGCVALTDAQHLLQGSCFPSSGEAQALLRRHTVPWVAGLFELFIRLAARLTKDVPGAFAGYPEVLEEALLGSDPGAVVLGPSGNTHESPNFQEPWLPIQAEAALRAALACRPNTPDTSADQLDPSCLPVVSLVLLRIVRSLQQLGLGKVEAIGRELFPTFDSGWLSGGSMAAAAPPNSAAAAQREKLPVASRLRAATQSLVTAYVFCCGQEAAESTIMSLAAYGGAQLQAGQASCSSKPQSGTAGSLAPLIKALRHGDCELAILMEESTRPGGSPTQLPGVEGHQQPHRRLGRPFGRRRTAIECEMERLFARKQRVYSAVPLSRTKAVMGVFRIAARAVLEFVRGCYFNAAAAQQLQAECEAAACAIRELVQPEDASVVDGFFDEIVASAGWRCIDVQASRAGTALESSADVQPDADIDATLSTERSIASPFSQPL